MNFNKILNDNIIEKYVKECSDVFESGVNVERGLPKAEVRTYCENVLGGYMMSYNERLNTIFYHPDCIYLKDHKLLKTLIAHEMCHWVAGRDDVHGPKFWNAATKIEKTLDIYKIYEKADTYGLEDIDAYSLNMGSFLKGLFERIPELESYYKLTTDIYGGHLTFWDEDNEVFLVRPSFYNAESLKNIDDEEREDVLIELDDFSEWAS